jgi:RP/EB family microtubule-associated protein
MLKSGYFTNRNEIIDWINSILHIQMTKIEQLGSGNIYCHLLDAAYPSKVPLQKVKWSAYLEIDFIYNFKILQNCFEHLGINKNIEVKLDLIRYRS